MNKLIFVLVLVFVISAIVPENSFAVVSKPLVSIIQKPNTKKAERKRKRDRKRKCRKKYQGQENTYPWYDVKY
jgi:hypothetical protein